MRFVQALVTGYVIAVASVGAPRANPTASDEKAGRIDATAPVLGGQGGLAATTEPAEPVQQVEPDVQNEPNAIETTATVAPGGDFLLDDCERTRRSIHARATSSPDPQVRKTILGLMPDCSKGPSAQLAPVVLTNSLDEDIDDDSTPPLSGRRIVGELVLGGLGLVGGAFGGALIGAAATKSYGGLALGGTLGGLLGATTGVYVIGSAGNETGSLPATAAGAGLGLVLGVVLAEKATDSKSVGPSTLAIAIASPAVGALVGFNMTRRWRSGHPRDRTAWVPIVSAGDNTLVGVGGRF
jgi:hypothetical protein